jgi:protoporphyrinogen oxidase
MKWGTCELFHVSRLANAGNWGLSICVFDGLPGRFQAYNCKGGEPCEVLSDGGRRSREFVMVDFVVSGGGYRGVLAAAILRKKGYGVTLVDSAKTLGGVLQGGQWKQYALDLGCHMFDNTHPEHTRLLQEILGDAMVPLEVKYAGRTGRQRHENFTVPSLANSAVPPATLLFDLLSAKSKSGRQGVQNYEQYLVNRFGESAGRLLVQACRKKVQYEPSQLDPVASRVVLFDRVNLFEQDLTLYLKSLPGLDDVLAAHSTEDPMRFYPEAKAVYPHRNFYPKGGTNQFGERAHAYLTQLGVRVLTGCKVDRLEGRTAALDNGEEIRFTKLFWTLELEKAEKLALGHSDMEDHIHPVPMVVVYFEVPLGAVSDYTYLHDHSDDTAVFRVSSAGKYSQQVVEGNTYICCEIPTDTDSAYWKNPELFIEQFWEEAIMLGMIAPQARYTDHKVLKAPVTFKLPKLGFSAMEARVRAKLAAFEHLILTDSSYFSTQDIAMVIHKELQEL